jgi:hypothetical protein
MTQLRSFALTDNTETFREGASWCRNGRDWAREQRDNAIRRAHEQATHDLGESANASFSTVCETSSNKSVTSITEPSYFSFNDTNETDTPDESLRSGRSPKWSRGKHHDL